MADMLPLVVAGIAGLSILLIIIGVAAPRSADQVQERLIEYGTRPMTLEELELSLPFSDRIVKPMIRGMSNFILRFAPQRSLANLQHKLELAGRPNNWTPREFIGIRGLAATLLGILGFLLLSLAGQTLLYRIGLGIVLSLLGFYLPSAWLGSKIKKRQEEAVKALPDALDLLTISVEAGLGFDAALNKVVEKWDNELSHEFMRVIAEMRVGKKRADALRDMAKRMEVSDVTSFIAAIIQADQLGVSISKVLRIQSEQMRIRRRQRAEEKARKAPIKMLIPMVFLIFPALFIVLLGPSAIIVKNSGVLGAL